ncbi:hypothetical protein [Massilia eurypsychrophila]|uniref:hypothetical protein n=1 Tax=Massilia eurypsychrophila TaxID=1485217 RepID=UPI00103440D1|nr:hypothetical protein [Massilia eurypsychrophila]
MLLIALILAGGQFLLQQGRMLISSQGELDALTSVSANISAYKRQLISQLQASALQAENDSLHAIDDRIIVVRLTLQENTTEGRTSLVPFPLASPKEYVGHLVDNYKRKLATELGRQELTYLQKLRAYLIAAAGRAAADRELARLAIASNLARTTLLQLRAARDKLNTVDAFRMEHSLILDKKLRLLQKQLRDADSTYTTARTAYDGQAKAVAQFGAIDQRPRISLDQAAIERVTQDMVERLDQNRAAVTGNLVARFAGPVVAVMPMAFMVLLLSFAGHFMVKAFFYYFLAPLAARCRPIQLEAPPHPHRTTRQGVIGDSARPGVSSVSLDVRLGPDEELLILPEFLQSSPTSSVKDTKFLLDRSCIWTSLVSGMYMLTRVRAKSGDDRIVISSDADPMSEIALVTIPSGSSMVFQPRGMVGVIYQSSEPLKIARRWRIFSAHAWLTLQLRYLIFRGPVTLIVRGSRGVRVEPAGQARTISQYATLGFSSHLEYATVRSETFWPYFQNRAALLQDKFDGENGYYVYDETPRFGKSGGFFTRCLEGITDTVLRVFGI